MFNCSLACSSSPTPVTWYMTFPSNGRTLPVSQYTQMSQVKSIYGIDVARASFDGCAQGGYRVEQLAISNAGMDLNLLPVQCSTLCFDGNCACQSVQVFFSKFAVLLITGTSIELYMYMRTYSDLAPVYFHSSTIDSQYKPRPKHHTQQCHTMPTSRYILMFKICLNYCCSFPSATTRSNHDSGWCLKHCNVHRGQVHYCNTDYHSTTSDPYCITI